MTEAERDAAFRRGRARLAAAKEDAAAILLELRRYSTTFRSLHQLCDGILRDAAMRTAHQEIPDLPSSEQLRRLLDELRTAIAVIEECETFLRQANAS